MKTVFHFHRYANRAKNIKNKPKINEDPKDALLREFQEEIAKYDTVVLGPESLFLFLSPLKDPEFFFELAANVSQDFKLANC